MSIEKKLTSIKYAVEELQNLIDAIDNSEIDQVPDHLRNLLANAGNGAEELVTELENVVPAPGITYLKVIA